MSSLKYKTWSYILLTIVHGHISAGKTPSNTTIFGHRKLISFNISQYMYYIVSRHTLIKPECIYLYNYVLLMIYINLRMYLVSITLTSSIHTYVRWTNNQQLSLFWPSTEAGFFAIHLNQLRLCFAGTCHLW